MRNLAKNSLYVLFLTCGFYSTTSFSQESKTKLIQDDSFEQLLAEKKKVNTDININNSYKIQIFYGNASESKKKLMEFQKEFKDIESTIVYANPTFKVFVGSYKTRLHAERALLKIQEKYPAAFIIKPN